MATASVTKAEVGTVKVAIGEVKVVGVDGVTRTVGVGDKVYAKEVVETGANSVVQVQLANGNMIDMGRESKMTLEGDLLAGTQETAPRPAVDDAARLAAEANAAKIAALQAKLDAGDISVADELTKLQGTAAGGQPAPGAGAAGDGSGSEPPPNLDQANQIGPVTAGFNTAPVTLAPTATIPFTELPVPPIISINVQVDLQVQTPPPPVGGAADVPFARTDTDVIPSGTTVATGNVITGLGTTSGANGADTPGSEGARVTTMSGTPVSNNNGVITVAGEYGTLTINPDGRYTYQRNEGAPDSVVDKFTYTLTDGSGDSSTADLIIDVGGNGDSTPDLPGDDDGDGVVISGNSATLIEGTGGPDKIYNFVLSLNHPYILDVHVTYTILPGTAQSPADFGGALTATVTIPAGQTQFIVPVSIEQDHLVESTEGFSIVLSNPINASVNPNADRAVVNIIDDDLPPNARDDTYIVVHGQPNELSSVLTHRNPGEVTDDSGAGPGETLTVTTIGTIITAQGGTVVMNANGTFVYTPPTTLNGPDTFVYSMTDGYNGTSTATVTLRGDNEPPTVEFLSPGGGPGDGAVKEAGLSVIGSASASNSEFTHGRFRISDPDGLADVVSVTINGQLISMGNLAGSVITTPVGVMTVNAYDSTTGIATFAYELKVPAQDIPNQPEQDAFTVTVTDSATATSAPARLAIDIIDDDGPTVAITAATGVTVGLDETATSSTEATINTGVIAKGNDLDVEGAGYISTATSSGAVVNVGTELYGADGAAISGAKVYALTVGNSGVSGLAVTDGATITLQLLVNNGVVVGVVDSGAFAGLAAFAITINAATGVVTVEQYLSLHQDSLTSTPDDTMALIASALGVTVTLTDGDGDTVLSNTANIGSQITFDDDGPGLSFADLSVYGGVNIVGVTSAPTGVSLSYGTDGSGSIALTWSNPVSGYELVKTGDLTWTAKKQILDHTNSPTGSYGDSKDWFSVTLNNSGTYNFKLLDVVQSEQVSFDISDALSAGTAYTKVSGNYVVTSTKDVYKVTMDLTATSPYQVVATATAKGQETTFSYQNSTIGVGGDDVLHENDDVFVLTFTNVTGQLGTLGGATMMVTQFNPNNDVFKLQALVVDNGKKYQAELSSNQAQIIAWKNFDTTNLPQDSYIVTDYNGKSGHTFVYLDGSVEATEVDGTNKIKLNQADDISQLKIDSVKSSIKVLDFDIILDIKISAGDIEQQFVATVTDADGDTSSDTFAVNIIAGTAGDDKLNTLWANDKVSGGAGNDTINTDGGDDTLYGGEGNDVLMGGAGNDILEGGAGADTYKWLAGDKGNSATPAVDTVVGFTEDPGDKLDLSDLLPGAAHSVVDLDSLFLKFSQTGADTTIEVYSSGNALAVGALPDQKIVLQGVNMSDLGNFNTNIISNLLANGKLVDG